jgi:hypothetical protein
MSELRFPRWFAVIGVFAGMMIALIVPVAVLLVGDDLTSTAKLVVIILALVIGACLAGIAAVVGMAMPTAMIGGAIDLSRVTGGECCRPVGTSDTCCADDAKKSDSAG